MHTYPSPSLSLSLMGWLLAPVADVAAGSPNVAAVRTDYASLQKKGPKPWGLQ